MVELTATGIRTGTAEELYGPLNDVEQKNAPPGLWLHGDVELLRGGQRVAVVGSRSPSPAGQQRAAQLARRLAGETITVVSGLALGIDTIAHRTAMAAGGRTIAVLGTPLDECQPRQNSALQEEIGRDHLLVSQFPPGHPVLRSNFPRRNRIISGLSLGVLVVEAAQRSGALITARLAAEEHHREVMALPGRVDSPASTGCLKAIREGSTKRVLAMLEGLADSEDAAEREKYAKFWKDFGVVLKEGIGEDHANQE